MRKHGRGRWVLLRDRGSGQLLDLNWYPAGSEFDGPYSPGEWLDHIGFSRSPTPSVRSEPVALAARPTVVTPESTDGWQAHVGDQDSNWIEIYR